MFIYLLKKGTVEERIPFLCVPEHNQEVGGVGVESPEHHLPPVLAQQHICCFLCILLQMPRQIVHQHSWENCHP